MGMLAGNPLRFLAAGLTGSGDDHGLNGNILMEPNDQYLCIVPKQGDVENEPVLLPFEGDLTLSVILSMAFLLADDSKIKVPTIISQLKR